MEKDRLIECPCCNGIAYELDNTSKIKTKSCFTCGFCTSTLMKEGEQFYKEQMEVLPELYKDILIKDKDGLTWMPTNINLPQNGMVFVNGTNKDNWEWVGVLAVPVKEEEKEKFKKKNGGYYEYRMDNSTMKGFGKDGFQEALEYLKVV